MKTCFSIFSGAGGSDIGMIAAGYTSRGGVEYHQPAADIYNLNHPVPLTVADVLTIDRIPTVDLLWLSPPCPSFSLANANKGETENDLNLARHLAKLIADSRTFSIAIENVRGYAASQSLAIIVAKLVELGYGVTQSIECAANYGAPTSRERLIVRASRSPMRELVHTHQKPARQTSLFALPNWVSWWDVVKDRIDELPRSTLTENQQAVVQRRIDKNIELPVLVSTEFMGQNGAIYRSKSRPSHSITATSGGCDGTRERILIERVGYYNGSPNVYPDDRPAPTVRASQHIDDKGTYRVAYNVLDRADCYAADIKCLAAWQGFPPNYNWGDNRAQAGRAIGNAVPPQLAKAIALSL